MISKKKEKKKKKALQRKSDGFFGQNRKFTRFFRPNHRQLLHNLGTQNPSGGCFHFLSKNRPQKHLKRAILHTVQANRGDSSPPKATLLISANTSGAGAKTAKHYSKDTQSHKKESGLRTNHFVLLMLKRDRAYPVYEFKRKHVCDNEM